MFIPLTEEEVKEYLRVEIPPLPARAGWAFDVEAIKQAQDILTITLPVRIRFITATWRDGTQYYHRTGKYHRVTLNQSRHIDLANEYLWHELVHCSQQEAYARKTGRPIHEFDNEYNRYGRTGNVYRNNPYEIQANNIAAKMAPTHPLLKEVAN